MQILKVKSTCLRSRSVSGWRFLITANRRNWKKKLVIRRTFICSSGKSKFGAKPSTYALFIHTLTCWFHGSSFKGVSIVFPVFLLAKVESSQKSNPEVESNMVFWTFFRAIFAAL